MTLDVRRSTRPSIAGLVVLALSLSLSLAVANAAPPDRAALAEQRKPHTPVAIEPRLLDAYAGYYRDARTGSIMAVTREGDHLLTRRPPNPPVPEYAYSPQDFFFTFVPQQNTFVTDAAGAVVRVVHHQGGRDETLERIDADTAQREIVAIESRVAAEQAPHVERPVAPASLDSFVGTYQLTPRLMVTVTREADTLRARVTGQQAYQVYPYAEHDFFYTVVAAQLSFEVGADGRADAVVLRQGGQDRRARRVDPALAQALDQALAAERAPHSAIGIDPSLLDAYAGRYRNADLEMTATRQGDHLAVQVTGFARYPVYPYGEHDFFAATMPAQITFVHDGAGHATQMVRHEYGVDEVMDRAD